MGCFLSEQLIGFACVGLRAEWCHTGVNSVEETGFICRSCERLDSGTDPVRF